MNSFVASLIVTHRAINQEIRRELKKRVPDHFRLVRLKKHRLTVKDELYRRSPEPGSLLRAARVMFGALRPRTLTASRAAV